MIIKASKSNVFETEAKHIAFAINMEGINDSGFAGQVASKYWNELTFCGKQELGTVLSKNVGNKTFHALVCHSLHNKWGDNQNEIIKECFDKIPSNGELVATVAIGTGFVGMLSGADFSQIICGMHDSKQKIILHAGYSLDDIIEYYNLEKGKNRTK